MTHTIRLCGGHADGQTFSVNRLPPAWETIEPNEDLSNWWRMDAQIPVTATRVTYFPVGIVAGDEHLYATRELFNQLRTAFERQRFMRDMPRVGELPTQLRLCSDEYIIAVAARLRDRINNPEADPWEDPRLDDPVNTRVYPESISTGDCAPATLKGPDPLAGLPAAPVWRKKTDKLIKEIDEVTGDDA